jgi:hypothetical protein
VTSKQEVCRSVPLGKYTTAPDEKKAPHSPSEIRERKRNHSTRTRIVTEEKGLPPSTPEGQPNLPDVDRMPDPQEYHTPKRQRQRTTDNAATDDTTGKMNPNAELTPFINLLKDGMPRKSAVEVNPRS